MSNLPIRDIIVHCSATEGTMDIGATEIRKWHTDPPRSWSDIGYHYVIRRSGKLELGRKETKQGAHVRGKNRNSLGICLVGGLTNGEPDNNYTPEQFATLSAVLVMITAVYPLARVMGHRDHSPDLNGDGIIDEFDWVKICPCFPVIEWWAEQ